MIINAKATLAYEQISDRIKKGVNGIEIQLLSDFSDYYKSEPKDYLDKRIIEDIKNHQYTINVIHPPIYGEEYSCEIEYRAAWNEIDKSCELAQYLAGLQHQMVLVVIHISENIHNLKEYNAFQPMVDFILQLLAKYPDIELGFENTSLFSYKGGKNFSVRPALRILDDMVIFSNIELVKYLKHRRCGAVIDTCHLILTQNNLRNINRLYHDKVFEVNVIKEAFCAASHNIKLIHLNNAKSHGYGDYHGTPFDIQKEEDKKRLKEIYAYYQEHADNCPITIEVWEEDYLNAINLKTTMLALQSIM